MDKFDLERQDMYRDFARADREALEEDFAEARRLLIIAADALAAYPERASLVKELCDFLREAALLPTEDEE